MIRSSGRYLSLDAMRGLAAIAVALFHYENAKLAPVGYLAVDFFFALSGFVLAKAYGERLARGESVRAFLEARLVRLWPVFIGALMVGLAWNLQRTIRGAPYALNWSELGVSALFNAVMLPSPATEQLYPFDPAFWSIGTELVINVVFALVLVRLGLLSLLVVAAAGAVALMMMIGPAGCAVGGLNWDTIDLGLVRTLFSFTVGCLLAKVKEGDRRPSLLVIPVLALLGALLIARPSDDMRRGFDLLAILLAFPLLLFVGSRFEPPSWLARGAVFLGDISYPFYAVHLIILSVTLFGSRLLGVPETVMLPTYLLLAIAAAAALGRYWDKPVRRWLSARLALRRAAEPQLL